MIKYDLTKLFGLHANNVTVCQDQPQIDGVDYSSAPLDTKLKCKCGCGNITMIPAFKIIMSKRVLTCGSCASLIGRKIGALTIVEDIGVDKSMTYQHRYKVVCECGHESIMSISEIKRTGKCYKCLEKKMINKKIGNFTVLSLDHVDKSVVWYNVRCECGNSKLITEDFLLNKKK